MHWSTVCLREGQLWFKNPSMLNLLALVGSLPVYEEAGCSPFNGFCYHSQPVLSCPVKRPTFVCIVMSCFLTLGQYFNLWVSLVCSLISHKLCIAASVKHTCWRLLSVNILSIFGKVLLLTVLEATISGELQTASSTETRPQFQLLWMALKRLTLMQINPIYLLKGLLKIPHLPIVPVNRPLGITTPCPITSLHCQLSRKSNMYSAFFSHLLLNFGILCLYPVSLQATICQLKHNATRFILP